LIERSYSDTLTPKHERGAAMQKWVCTVCGYIYDPAKGDPESGIAAGTPFEKLPSDWVCPVCGASKEDFEKSSD
jgi:rubredoxin